MNMENLKLSVLRDWLHIDFTNTAYKIGFCEQRATISEELIIKSIRCLDYETAVSKKPSVNYVITIIALKS